MAVLAQKPTVACEVHLILSEAEARALEAVTVYGVEAFAKAFHEQLGGALDNHGAGLHRLFVSIREQLPPILARANDARAVFEGRATLAPAKPKLVLS